MSRIIPHPLISVALALMWMMLTQFNLGNLILGSALALYAGRALALIEPTPVRVKSWTAFLRLMGVVSLDIARSNWQVASLILTNGRGGTRKSGKVLVPLRVQSPIPLAFLAIVVTATPGTAWLKYDRNSGILTLHVFDLKDPAEWRALIRDRYEALMMEAFA